MENFSITFFDVRSALKGRFRSILAVNSWLNCVDWCRIKSKMQENHEELKIFLKIYLISSQFNQELSLQRERTSIYREIHAKNVVHPIRWWNFNCSIAQNRWDRDPRHIFHSLWFQPFDRAKSVGSWPMTRIPLRVISIVCSSSKNLYEVMCLSTISQVRDLIASVWYYCSCHIGTT